MSVNEGFSAWDIIFPNIMFHMKSTSSGSWLLIMDSIFFSFVVSSNLFSDRFFTGCKHRSGKNRWSITQIAKILRPAQRSKLYFSLVYEERRLRRCDFHKKNELLNIVTTTPRLFSKSHLFNTSVVQKILCNRRVYIAVYSALHGVASKI